MTGATVTQRGGLGAIPWLKVLTVLSAATIVQVAVFDQFWVAGRIRIDLMLLAVVSVGLRAPERQATILGFVIGLFVDLMRFGPFGLHALIFCIAGWVLANNGARMLQVGPGFRLMQGAFSVLLVTAASWTAAAVFGQRPPAFGNDSLISIGLTAVVGGLLLLPVDAVTRRVLDVGPAGSRIPRTDLVRAEP